MTEDGTKVLLIVDPQNDFISGSLAVNDADKAMDYLVDWIDENYKNLDSIVVSKDWHPANHISFEAFGGIWPVHCVQNTKGSEIYSALQKKLDELEDKLPIIYIKKAFETDKEEYSAFENNLPKVIEDADELFISGIAGDVCVRYTVSDIRRHEFAGKMTYLRDAIAYINKDEEDF